MNRAQLMAKRNGLVKEGNDLIAAGLTDETRARMSAINEEIRAIDSDLEALDRFEGLRAAGDASAGTLVGGRDTTQDGVQREPVSTSRAVGEMMLDIAAKRERGTREITTSGSGSAGILIQPQVSGEIFKMDGETAIVRPRARVISAGTPPDAEFTMPTLAQGASGAYGGIVAKWTEEGGDISQTDFNMKEIALKPKELAAYVAVTNKALANAEAVGSLVSSLLPEAMANQEDIAYLTGNGVGKARGVMLSKARIIVKRKTANTVVFEDCAKMLGKMLPSSLGASGSGRGPVWLAHVSLLEVLLQLQDPSGRYIMILGDATKGTPTTLLGYPVKWTGKVSDKGSEGDLSLIDFSYYAIKDGSGPYAATSEHVLFLSNKTVFKFFRNTDGQLMHDEPLTLEDGKTQVSSVVVLG